ncbi:MAG TPA: M20/M25/M40 family metallo-hydrolase [Methylomirabilota bacterium]|jgi:membrane-associated protease RseP (regulator of RpoE activity)
MRRSSRSVVVALALALTTVSLSAQPAVVVPTPAALLERVERLAAPEMEGRASGTRGNEAAAQYLADALAAAGLRGGGDGGTFIQSFVIGATVKLAPAATLSAVSPAPRAFTLDREWRPHGGSREAEVIGDVVFVGYGIAESGYDDYAGLDVAGKIVLVLEGAPPHLTGAKPSRLDKLLLARRHGAAAILVVTETLPGLAATGTPVGIVSAALTPRAADALLAPAGLDTSILAARIASRRAPASVAVAARARVHVALARDERRTANVVAVLPGTDPARAAEAVVVGAHFDHLGQVGGVLHPGADDNASGTALVVELARALAAAGGTARTLVFVLFSGEEIGLLGSGHYVRHPAIPLDRTVAMLNLDMVGRLRDGRLYVGGTDSATTFNDAVTDAARGTGVDVVRRGTPYSASDHVRFYDGGAPVLFFFTGMHDDYHRAGDTADKINAAGMAKVAEVAVRLVTRLADGARPLYVKLDRPARRGGSGPPGSAFFGIMADRDAGSDGLRLAGVQPGSAAARAGVQEGDVIIRFGGATVNSFDEIKRAIASRRPGDHVDVVYLRNGEERAASTTLDAQP